MANATIQLNIGKLSNEQRPAVAQLRHTVFTQEQGVPENLLFDQHDDNALHALLTSNTQLIASGRILNDGHIGRVAVLKQHRGNHHGQQIVKALIQAAKQAGYPRVYLGSQIHAVGFYQQLGFSPYGQRYTEAGIEHQWMEVLL